MMDENYMVLHHSDFGQNTMYTWKVGRPIIDQFNSFFEFTRNEIKRDNRNTGGIMKCPKKHVKDDFIMW